jgi:hypothetical protein
VAAEADFDAAMGKPNDATAAKRAKHNNDRLNERHGALPQARLPQERYLMFFLISLNPWIGELERSSAVMRWGMSDRPAPYQLSLAHCN